MFRVYSGENKHPDCEIFRQIFMRHMGQGYKNYVTAACQVVEGGLVSTGVSCQTGV